MYRSGRHVDGHDRQGLLMGLGHSARLRSDDGVRWLVLGHLLVFALAIQDEETVEALVALLGLSSRLIFPLEIAFSLMLFVAWGCLMIGWVRLVERLRRERRVGTERGDA
ncbi:hypothetical protein H0I76_13535 [Limibaculum sp. M0105]|uniref:Uncharacterized protein n=1 Tax=Thermohalobaculum xanthum TaxID=2753746 RepID=A0A8J7M9E9_9RHOB|nr:hypothetical protein [Thermohalobaculum xanthum]MBK0400215.1 hypothetical protein [Thermohalobaculum xanthum]